LAARAELVVARVDLSQWRLEEASVRCRELAAAPQTDEATGAGAFALLSILDDEAERGALPRDGYLALLSAVSDAAAEPGRALGRASRLVIEAERAGRQSHLARALAFVARLQLARGDRKAARASAVRASSEAAASGCVDARVSALLALAALAREADDAERARECAEEAHAQAVRAGLSVEGLVASRAVELIQETSLPVPLEETGEAATMADSAVAAAARWLADLGLTVVRPYRVVSADGSDKRVAEASPEILQMADRGLVIDGVREVIVRTGNQVADLRRRSLLKRLLFLFAARPGEAFTKEQIVESVWEVEYHPLRHDAALFTNIMRIRRLLGADGTELIRVSDDGYRFHPPKDFLFVARVED